MTKIICDLCGDEVTLTDGFSTYNFIQFPKIQQDTAPVKQSHDYCDPCTKDIIAHLETLKGIITNKKQHATI